MNLGLKEKMKKYFVVRIKESTRQTFHVFAVPRRNTHDKVFLKIMIVGLLGVWRGDTLSCTVEKTHNKLTPLLRVLFRCTTNKFIAVRFLFAMRYSKSTWQTSSLPRA
jgi:hypothetical protein